MIIKIPAKLNFIAGVRVCIAYVAYNFGFSESEVYQIETIVDELCSNAIEHGSKSEDDVVILECVFSKGELELKVKDTGNEKFNVEEVFAINKRKMEQGWKAKELYERGRGLIIVQRLVDNLDIKMTNEGTMVIAYKEHREEEM